MVNFPLQESIYGKYSILSLVLLAQSNEAYFFTEPQKRIELSSNSLNTNNIN